MTRVAIVGSGIAGLTCAANLRESGIRVSIFDKGRRPGGRVSTRVTEISSYDHGAQYFTARDQRFLGRVEALVEAGVIAEWRGVWAEWDGKVLVEKENQPCRYVGVPAMNALPIALSSGLEVEQSYHVERVERRGEGWWICRRGGESTGPFDWLLITAPGPQAVQLVGGTTTLPRATFGASFALLATFAERVAIEADGIFVNKGALSWVARNSSKPGRPQAESWVLHSGEAWTQTHFEADSSQLESELLAEFAEIASGPLPPRLESAIHRWRYAIPEPLPDRVYVEADRKLAFGGDYCGGPRVEGAYLSGLALADVVASDS